jgi:methyltransferase OMS1
MLRAVALSAGGLAALASGIVVGSAAGNAKRKIEVHPERYNQIATGYDKEVGDTEASAGIEKLRLELTTKARGRVLETCAGTGRNNGFYDAGRVTELVLMDSSMEMLEEARKKPFPAGLSKIRLLKSDTLTPFESESFDTVVDTFGLCSVADPDTFLQDVKRVLKPGGQALFLEHGRSESLGPLSWAVNVWLDFRAPSHAKAYGCLWNRELGRAIEASGLKVENKTIHHAGTCTMVVATKQ